MEAGIVRQSSIRRSLKIAGALLLLISVLTISQGFGVRGAAALTPFTGQAVVNAASGETGYHYCFDGGTPSGPSVGITDSTSDGSYSNCNQIGAIGFDCTGLTLYAIAQASGGSVILPHDGSQASAAMADGGQVISNQASLQPGDLVYFDYNAGHGLGSIDHVGIETSAGVLSAVSEKWGIGTHSISWYAAGGLSFVGGVRLWSSGGGGGGGGGAPANGTYVSYNGAGYAIAGGAPIFVQNWANVGDPPVTPIDTAQWNALAWMPADGTAICGHTASGGGGAFVVAGGGLVYISSFSNVPVSSCPEVDEFAIDNADGGPGSSASDPLTHLHFTPADGTAICGHTASGGGGAFVVAGGGLVYISSFSNVPVSSCPEVDEFAIDNADGGPGVPSSDYMSHLRFTPADGTFLLGEPGANTYRVAGGAALPIADCSVLAGCPNAVEVDQYSITSAGSTGSGATLLAHLQPSPTSGTQVEGMPSGDYWQFTLGGWLATSLSQSSVQVDDSSLSAYSFDSAPAFGSPSSTNFIQGNSSSFTAAAKGYPTPVLTESGALPAGVTFNNGVFSGTPAPGTAGTYPITITATNGISPDAIQAFTLTVLPIGITTTSLPSGSVYSKTNKVLYSTTLTASGGNPPYKWSLAPGSTPLPPGLKLSSKGVISGKAKAAGTYSFTVHVVDTRTKANPPTQNMATAALSITIR